MNYSELQTMPTRYRHWFVRRLEKHFNQKKEKNSTNNQDSYSSQISKMEEFINKKL